MGLLLGSGLRKGEGQSELLAEVDEIFELELELNGLELRLATPFAGLGDGRGRIGGAVDGDLCGRLCSVGGGVERDDGAARPVARPVARLVALAVID